MTDLPVGTVTFLFTDIEGSTQLWEKFPEAMQSALAQHDSILKESIGMNGGHIIKTTGDGVHAVFEKAIDAVNATLDAQCEFITSATLDASEIQIRVRMGLHTGEAEFRDGDYYGQTLNRAARIMAVGHGGQVLLSGITADVVREHLPVDINLHDLGEHRLKDLIRPERLFQLNASGLQTVFPPLRSLNLLPNNLPSQLTSFIGREHEIKEAGYLLSSTRLLTFIGPGGTGKTRLSLQVAAEQSSKFKDGVWLTELAPISNPANITTAIASVFELREVQNIPILTILLDYLRAKQLLLVLDNCEHLVEASAKIVDQLLHACPQLKIIASSREALGIDGETVFRVPSLLEDEAARLFIERAAKAESRFRATEHNASSIAQICSRLDGIPLAIELAAARVKLFTPEQIAERLDDRFKLLTGGSRTALPRQQTLRALIDWSYQSLNESEQRALRQLAVFSGGWTIDGAEAVLGADEAMDGLMGLVNKSLVNVEEQENGSHSPTGESLRYRYLETIRQYAMEKLLESGETVDARNRHLDYMHQLAERSERKMFGEESVGWLDQMVVEHDNLRAALEWALSNDLEKALNMTVALGGFWTSRDYNTEGRMICKAVLEKTAGMENLNGERARVCALMGWMSITTGYHKDGRAAAEEGIALARKTGDKRTLGRCLGVLSLACNFLGDFPSSLRAAEEGEAITRQGGFGGELALMLTIISQAVYLTKHDLVQAKKLLDEAVTLGRDSGFQWANSIAAYGQAHVAMELGDLKTARQKFMESMEYARSMGNKRLVYSSQSDLAHILRQHGELDEPLVTYRDLLPKWADLGHRAAVAHELECIAYILTRKEEPEKAVLLLSAAQSLRKTIEALRTRDEESEYEQEVNLLQTTLGEELFSTKWNEGRLLTMDEVIRLAME